MAWLIDLDGVVWRGEEPIPGSAEAVEKLRAAGQRVLFVTNNSSATLDEYREKLGGVGIEIDPDDLVTSAQAAASLLEAGATALVCAGPGVVEALRARGVETVREGDADAVVVGWHRDFDFDRLTAAFNAVRGGARLIGTNDDATYPTPSGAVPGGGAILSAVAYATSATPEVAGKPHQPIADLILERAGQPKLMVGDRPSTDGLLAERLGVPFVLVLTGVTPEDDLPEDAEKVYPDLAAAVDQELDG